MKDSFIIIVLHATSVMQRNLPSSARVLRALPVGGSDNYDGRWRSPVAAATAVTTRRAQHASANSGDASNCAGRSEWRCGRRGREPP